MCYFTITKMENPKCYMDIESMIKAMLGFATSIGTYGLGTVIGDLNNTTQNLQQISFIIAILAGGLTSIYTILKIIDWVKKLKK